MNKDRITVFLLSTSMFFTGACGMTNEYLLGTLGSNLMGSTHEQIYVIIGMMMASMGLGSWLSQKIEKNLFEWFICIEMLLGIIGGISVLVVYAAFSHMAGYQAVLYVFAVSIGIERAISPSIPPWKHTIVDKSKFKYILFFF